MAQGWRTRRFQGGSSEGARPQCRPTPSVMASIGHVGKSGSQLQQRAGIDAPTSSAMTVCDGTSPFHQLAASGCARRPVAGQRLNGWRCARCRCSASGRMCAGMCSTSKESCENMSASSPMACGFRIRRAEPDHQAELNAVRDAGFLGGLAHDPREEMRELIMSDRMLVATRKGLLSLVKKNGGWHIGRTDFAGISVTAALPTRAMARCMRRSSTAISVPSCIAPRTAAKAGRNCRRRRFQPTPPMRQPCSRSGLWKRAARMCLETLDRGAAGRPVPFHRSRRDIGN